MTEFGSVRRDDFAIVGSGFDGSVSALRLSETGYSVVVLEMASAEARRLPEEHVGRARVPRDRRLDHPGEPAR